MVVFTAMLAAMAIQGTAQAFDDYEVKNVRPSKIVAQMTEIVTSDIRVEALDSQGKIRVTGSESDRQECLNWIKMFDIAPLSVTLDVRVVSKIDKVRYGLQLTIQNNETFSFNETGTDIRVSLTPRVNGDGTITLFEEMKRGDKTTKITCRLKQGQFVRMPAAKAPWFEVTDRLNAAESDTPVLIVSPKIVARPLSADDEPANVTPKP